MIYPHCISQLRDYITEDIPHIMHFPQSSAFCDIKAWYGVECYCKNPHQTIGCQTEARHGIPYLNTSAFSFFDGQRHSVLGQAMDLNTMVRNSGLYHALERHSGDLLLSLRAEDSGQAAHRSTSMEEGKAILRAVSGER